MKCKDLVLETTKRVITIDNNLPIIRPRTIKGTQGKKRQLSQKFIQNSGTRGLISKELNKLIKNLHLLPYNVLNGSISLR